uniref:Uncharacterized protein n=1 Tax=Timema cristinae TaxID=61476 RepID=A0A7R9DPM6_TIMCR|nr:unnamed protein product [Timema cristinae]
MEFNFYKFSSRVMQDLDTAYDTRYNKCAEFPRPFSWVHACSTVCPPPLCARLAVHGLNAPGVSGCVARRLTLVSDSRPCASAVHESLALGWTDLLPLEEFFSALGRTVYMWGVF